MHEGISHKFKRAKVASRLGLAADSGIDLEHKGNDSGLEVVMAPGRSRASVVSLVGPPLGNHTDCGDAMRALDCAANFNCTTTHDGP